MDPSPSLVGIMRIQGRVQIFARERKGYGGTNNRIEQPKLFLCPPPPPPLLFLSSILAESARRDEKFVEMEIKTRGSSGGRRGEMRTRDRWPRTGRPGPFTAIPDVCISHLPVFATHTRPANSSSLPFPFFFAD